MDDKMKVAIVVIAILVLAVPLLGKLLTEQPAPGKGVATAAKAATTADPIVAVEPPLLTAQNLVNSKWKMFLETFEVTITFAPNGVLIAESPVIQQLTRKPSVEGTWSVNGADLTVSASAMGKSITEKAQISGTNILARGKPLTRLQ